MFIHDNERNDLDSRNYYKFHSVIVGINEPPIPCLYLFYM